MTREEIEIALQAGMSICWAGGTLWASYSETSGTVYAGCYSPDECCQGDWATIEEFLNGLTEKDFAESR